MSGQMFDLSPPNGTNTAALAKSLVVKAAAGRLFGISGYSSNGGAQFIQVHDAAAVPADEAVPALVIPVAAGAAFSLDLGPRGKRFTTGIVICNSSTGPTKTIGADDCWLEARYY